MSGGTPTNSYVDTTQTNAYGYTANYQDNARAEREERRKRELADYAGKADYWEREYRRLIRLDPQCRDERTRVAEYNKNSFRLKSRGKW